MYENYLPSFEESHLRSVYHITNIKYEQIYSQNTTTKCDRKVMRLATQCRVARVRPDIKRTWMLQHDNAPMSHGSLHQ